MHVQRAEAAANAQGTMHALVSVVQRTWQRGAKGLEKDRWETSRKQLCTQGKASGQRPGGSGQPLRDSPQGAS